jgi:uncharacterized protein (DUF849 family)
MARLVKCCLNGAHARADHPAVPITAEELALEAAAAVAAGAFALHMHPRDQTGAQTLDPAWCDAAVAAVRAACPGTPVGLSTAAWIEPDLARRLVRVAAWRERPDFCSVNLSETGSERVMEALWTLGIGVEAGLASVEDAQLLDALGVAARCIRVLVEIDDQQAGPEAACREAAEIDATLDAAGVTADRLHHGFGPATWAVIRRGLNRGWDVRVGLEDVLTLPDGSTARGNADLVAAALALTRA